MLTCVVTYFQTIHLLESQIIDLEKEKVVGLRNIDSIEQEIQDIRREILSLKSKYLGFFSWW